MRDPGRRGGTETLLLSVDTDSSGRISGRCIASGAPLPRTLACVDEALGRIEPVATPLLHAVPLRLRLWPDAPPMVSDGTGVSQESLLETIKSIIPGIKKCFDEQRERDERVHGKWVFAWRIGADGAVSDLELRSKELEGTHAATCLADLLRRTHFEKHSVPSAEPVVFPFRY